ncbi:MAG TPA: lamin tail domain-containing protein, partial [Paludibacter sp.]|nr:lamin tail domain-containing protein [Paludibacter sp.]
YSKKPDETDFVLEGSAQHALWKTCGFSGVLFSNTSTTGSSYYFDDIVVTGNKSLDTEPPTWNSVNILQPDRLRLVFSEPMDFGVAKYELDPGRGQLAGQEISDDKTTVDLAFDEDFERGTLYSIRISGITDLAGNAPLEDRKITGIIEPRIPGDLVLNEIMFENPQNSLEYAEIANTSDKTLDLSGLVFTTRKTDGTLNSGVKIPLRTLILPHGYVAICLDADSVRNYHQCPAESNIVSTSTWSSLNNEEATVLLASSGKDTIFDEVAYSAKWHQVLVKNREGVALERINPLLPTQSRDSWTSAASEVNYGTPGYRNSQYREITVNAADTRPVRLDPEVFSPDNDGVDDVSFIRYTTEAAGYVANVHIFNPSGIRICTLASNALLSSNGFFVWDGHTDLGKNANAGIYVVYFEMFNAASGKRKQLKLPIVVTCR